MTPAAASARPTSARARFFAFAALGFLWLPKTVAISCALVAALLVADGGTPTSVVVGWVVCSILFVVAWAYATRPTLPRRGAVEAEGVELDAADRAVVVGALELHPKRTGRVLVDLDAGAWAGAGRDVVVGLPLLTLLSADELRAVGVLLEEGRATRGVPDWSARLAQGWSELARVLNAGGRKRFFLSRRVATWLAIRLDRASRELREAEDFAAEQLAIASVGEAALNGFRAKAALASEYLGTIHWPAVWARSDLDAEPPEDAVSELVQQLEEACAKAGITSPAPHAFTSERQQALIERLGDWWRENVAESWSAAYEAGPTALVGFDALDRDGALEEADVTRYAQLTERFRGAERAVPLYERAVAANDEDAVASYGLGRLLLTSGDDDGVPLIERSMELDAAAVLPGCELLTWYFTETDREEEAGEYVRRAAEWRSVLADAERERRSVRLRDPLESHTLSDEEVDGVRGVLERNREIERAFLARKLVVKLEHDAPVFVLGVLLRTAHWWQFERRDHGARLRVELARELPLRGDIWFVVSRRPGVVHEWFAPVLDAEIYVNRRAARRRAVGTVVTALVLLGWFASRGGLAIFAAH